MIDTQKSIILLTHPRSGSNWFQTNLPHKNLYEFFHWRILWEYTPTGVINPQLNSETKRPDIYFERIEKFLEYHKTIGPVSAKLFTMQYKVELNDFFINNSQEIQFISLIRKNLYNVLWSYCINIVTKKWKGIPEPSSIFISQKHFNTVISELELGFTYLNQIKKIVPVTEITYEDALNFEKSTWWKKDNVTYTIQNLKKHYEVVNRDEVETWINDYLIKLKENAAVLF